MCLVAEYTDDTQDAKGGRVGDGHCRMNRWGIDMSCGGHWRRDDEVVGIKEFF